MDREKLLKSYAAGYDQLIEALNNYSDEIKNYKPAPDKWSIHEIVIHLADAEINGYIRCMKIIAEPGSTASVYDQDAWTDKLGYAKKNTANSLQLFNLLRKIIYSTITSLPSETWNNFIIHPEKGKINIEKWIEIYDSHLLVHLKQMNRNFEEWNNSKK